MSIISDMLDTPKWYRYMLSAQGMVFDLAFGGKRFAAQKELDSRQTPNVLHEAVNRMGGLSTERCVPGISDQWLVDQHLSRYQWAAERVSGADVVELGSGMGYGSAEIATKAASVIGLDISQEAVDQAQQKYPQVSFQCGDITDPTTLPDAQIAVCFEVLEHVSDPHLVLQSVSERYQRLLLSFPNPLYAGSHLTPHHCVDWPLHILKGNLRDCGGQINAAYHQGSIFTPNSARDPKIKSGDSWWNAIWIYDVSFS